MTAARLVDELQEVFSGIETPPVGEVYKTLNSEFPIRAITNNQQHAMAITITERLIDFCSKHSANQDIYGYLDALATFIELYEKTQFKTEKIAPSQMLHYLMSLHDLKQSELGEEVGGQSVVSEILSGKRGLNVRQIRILSERFHVSPTVFF